MCIRDRLKALHNSSVYFAVGYLPFELSNLYPFLETQKNMLLVKQSVGMDLEQGACNHDHGDGHQHDHGSHDGNFDPVSYTHLDVYKRQACT